ATSDAPAELPAPVAMPEPPTVEAPQLVAAPAPEAVAPPVPDPQPAPKAPAAEPASSPVPAVTSTAAAPAAASTPPAERAPTASAPAPATRASSGGYHQEAWYRQRPASQYALQLLGTRSRQAAEDFVRRHSTLADIGYFETVHEGKPWFVVTQGAYAGRSQAQQGISRLPEVLQRQKPWPRSMGSIQQSLR